MPKVLASSGIIGTIFFPIDLSFVNKVKSLTYAIVVDIFLSPAPSKSSLKMEMLGIFILGPFGSLSGTNPPNFFRLSNKYFISLLLDLGL